MKKVHILMILSRHGEESHRAFVDKNKAWTALAGIEVSPHSKYLPDRNESYIITVPIE